MGAGGCHCICGRLTSGNDSRQLVGGPGAESIGRSEGKGGESLSDFEITCEEIVTLIIEVEVGEGTGVEEYAWDLTQRKRKKGIIFSFVTIKERNVYGAHPTGATACMYLTL